MSNLETIDALELQAIHFALGARLAIYPTPTLVSEWGELEAHALPSGTPLNVVTAFRKERGLDALQSEYLSLFGSHQKRISLHETEYGRMRGMGKGNDLADLCGFYKAFGLELTDVPELKEMPDHLACQLEFYSVLMARASALAELGDSEGAEVVKDARCKFLHSHLGRLAMTVAADERVRQHEVYGPILGWVAEQVEKECKLLDVKPAPLDFFDANQEPDEVCCAVSSGRPRSPTANVNSSEGFHPN